MKGLLEILAAHPLLSALDPEERAFLASCATERDWPAGAMLLREGEAADCFILILDGRAQIQLHAPDRGTIPVQTVWPGDLVGWSWLLEPPRWRFDARASVPCRAAVFSARRVREAMEAEPELGYALLKVFVAVLAARLEGARLQALNLYARA